MSDEIVSSSSSSGGGHAGATTPDVYSRLYDKRSYTGVYRKRFELECHDLSECVVHDLSNTMRTNLKYDVDPRTKRSSSPRLSISVSTEAVPVVAPLTPHEKASEPSPMKLRGDPNDPHTLLKAVFHYYCRFGRTGAKGVGEKTLDNANFSKLCRDSPGLLDASFASTDVDLIFIKAKKKGERRINYARFLDALGMIAIQKYSDLPLEASVPKLLEAHFARLPCMLEFTNGHSVQAIWQKRAERDDPAPSQSPVLSATADLPPLPPQSSPLASPPPPALSAVGSSASSIGFLFRRSGSSGDQAPVSSRELLTDAQLPPASEALTADEPGDLLIAPESPLSSSAAEVQ